MNTVLRAKLKLYTGTLFMLSKCLCNVLSILLRDGYVICLFYPVFNREC